MSGPAKSAGTSRPRAVHRTWPAWRPKTVSQSPTACQSPGSTPSARSSWPYSLAQVTRRGFVIAASNRGASVPTAVISRSLRLLFGQDRLVGVTGQGDQYGGKRLEFTRGCAGEQRQDAEQHLFRQFRIRFGQPRRADVCPTEPAGPPRPQPRGGRAARPAGRTRPAAERCPGRATLWQPPRQRSGCFRSACPEMVICLQHYGGPDLRPPARSDRAAAQPDLILCDRSRHPLDGGQVIDRE